MLGRKDYFGVRMVISERQWNKIIKSRSKEGPTGSGEEAKLDEKSEGREAFLSVVADSAEVHVWVIKRGMLDYLHRGTKKVIVERARHFTDQDRPEDAGKFKDMKAGLQKWEIYKERLAQDIVKGLRKAHH